MSVPVTPRQPATLPPRAPGPLALTGTVLATAAACAAVTFAAPQAGRVWVTATAVAAGVVVVVATTVAMVALRRAALRAAAAQEEAARLRTAHDRASEELARTGGEIAQLAEITLPALVKQLRDGASAATALDRVQRPGGAAAQRLLDLCAREIALGERRSVAAMAASVKAVDRVQAQANTILAHLRDMQDRYDEDVLGDLLQLDHNTSQLSLLADRLAVLMGGRSSRQWNKPIVMESILRGAVGRIAAYQRVRLHCTSTVAISGHAAEGIMHALAELMDNATNFSPPIDEVHVYVEERTAGIVVTIEDSGLKMADAALRRAEECVSGTQTDLALLQGTRLGLPVVGRLVAKHQLTVSYRPSSRGGTGVVVLIPQQLLAQPRSPEAEETPRSAPVPARAVSAPPPPVERERPARHAAAPDAVPGAVPGAEEVPPGSLPKRPRGRTLAAAEGSAPSPSVPPSRAPRGDAGSRFSAFRRASRGRPAGDGETPHGPQEPEPPAAG
ncbi:ATP-binding protein [Streptomyces sp. TRM 70351]|uniref:sensor histidine kinase n=1 Tax=Streptomyces sp. TRM 70351 TaxID=3116552 RepID=UPI002E7BC885|nr:ATP-binding protein [Streptomyces sp. TRM 70351]MEE1928943.1 ATP-binding protein [Streptomyces sp. TRM 70351]